MFEFARATDFGKRAGQATGLCGKEDEAVLRVDVQLQDSLIKAHGKGGGTIAH